MTGILTTAKRLTAAFVAVGVGTFAGFALERGVAADFSPPSWAVRNAATNGVWAALPALNLESSADDRTVAAEFEADAARFSELPRFGAVERSGVFGEIERDFAGSFAVDDAVFRGQSGTIPPAVSPTTSTTIDASSLGDSTSLVVTPPVVADDEPFQATVAPTNDDSTTIQKMFKYKQNISGSYVFMPKSKNDGLGVHEVEGRLLFAFPCQTLRDKTCLNNGYFLLTPSFTYVNWSLPGEQSLRYEMPGSTFDAGLSTTFAAKFSDLEVKVETQVGVASSFEKINGDALYIRGRAMGALPVDSDGKVKITGGVIYFDRVEYKLMPSGGFVWRPNPQNVVKAVFPDPRWSRYLTKVNETDWWFYVGGEIGGGRYLISTRDARTGAIKEFNTDYNDYRFGVGLTFDCPSRLRGCFEVGGSFNRKLVAKTGTWYSPKDSVYLKVGLLY